MPTQSYRAVRPTSRIQRSLEWDFPGRVYRAETRWFKTGAAPGSSNMLGRTFLSNFDLQPAVAEQLLVNRVTLLISMPSDDNWGPFNFGGTSALTNGIQFVLRKEGSQVHDYTEPVLGIGPIKTNEDLFFYTTPDFIYEPFTEQDNIMLSCSWDFVGAMAPVLLDDSGDVLRFVIDDNISDTGSPKMRARADCFLVKEE
jgi:hypothetical protein